MNFTYQILRQAEVSGDRIGNWKGMPVFACCSNNLKHKGSGAYFILYDDENKIVSMSQDDWYEYGTVSSNGNVSELDRRKLYGESKSKSAPKKAVPQTYTAEPQTEEVAAVVADVKIGIDVDATLKAARTQTIADLLAGFKYGLDN